MGKKGCFKEIPNTNQIQYHAIPYNKMKLCAIPCNKFEYNTIPCSTIQYNEMTYYIYIEIESNTIQYHAVPYILSSLSGKY